MFVCLFKKLWYQPFPSSSFGLSQRPSDLRAVTGHRGLGNGCGQPARQPVGPWEASKHPATKLASPLPSENLNPLTQTLSFGTRLFPHPLLTRCLALLKHSVFSIHFPQLLKLMYPLYSQSCLASTIPPSPAELRHFAWASEWGLSWSRLTVPSRAWGHLELNSSSSSSSRLC